MNDFEYHQPGSLKEALALKAELGAGGLLVSGGTDVHVQRREGLLRFDALVSLSGVTELMTTDQDADAIRIGSGVTLSDLMDSPLIAGELPILIDAISVMGCTQMRNMATMGGNVMSAVSSGDTITPLLALDASCVLVSNSDQRSVPIAKMFTGPRKTVAEPDEILLRLDIPKPGLQDFGAFAKLGRRAALDLAVVNMAAVISLSADKSIMEHARLAAGAVGPIPLRLYETEKLLSGQAPTPELLAQAAETALNETQPWDDVRASRWYREEMIKVWLPRVIIGALSRAGLEIGS